MTSPPVTNREYAYFEARGAEDPARVTALLGMEPDSGWHLGDPFEVGCRTLRRRGSRWRLDSGLDDTQALDGHIAALLARLEPLGEALAEVRGAFTTRIVCVAYSYQSFGWVLDVETQRRAVALGLGFEFDLYAFGDHHEEIVALREQVGLRQRRRCDAEETDR